mmetsp:Transcript_32834/g.61065  ORF Transcript_32834/g.61065 Transcript_32834/m.61065 type:complete len:185 (-) Transcript_32834:192-746(-)
MMQGISGCTRSSSSPSRVEFIGDGKYRGDGGMELEALWRGFPGVWKEIRGCPGRFTARGKRMRSTEVQALVEASGIKEAKIWRVEKSGKDPMDVVVFKTGGGVITYRKSANDKEVLVLVHTLNTESGLLRKLLDLRRENVIMENREHHSQRARVLTIILSFLPSDARSDRASSITRNIWNAIDR